ncbi:MAG: UbiX family flavin prenyltransferase [Desulfovibrio sp.]|jgi:4-hydroxy-3-polyprenylbenzoate decarboxylase|nr:UbiX family flavin prenyltransferase [Desulfovibrio sp.]
MRIIVGITGASGVLYGLELLRHLREGGHEIHAIVTPYGWKVLEHECAAGRESILSLVDYLHAHDDLAAPVASGSFRADVMAVVPCSMRTLAAIACGLADNLLCRTADVVLKERKNLILAVRETPLSAVHLENMLKLARLGVGILPASPGFYHRPSCIGDLVDMLVGRIMDNMGLENSCFTRWQGMPAR